MQKTTSELIINHLLYHTPQTVAELSRKLMLTKADIRYQLNRLIQVGRVRSISTDEKNKRGRPAAKFTVEANLYPNNLEEIVEAFLYLNRNNQNAIFILISEYLASKFDIPLDRHLIVQLNELIPKLNYQNYRARWETHIDGPLLFFHNCPYRTLLTKHPEFCAMDTNLLATTLKKSVLHKQSFRDPNSTVCKFQIMNL